MELKGTPKNSPVDQKHDKNLKGLKLHPRTRTMFQSVEALPRNTFLGYYCHQNSPSHKPLTRMFKKGIYRKREKYSSRDLGSGRLICSF